MSEGALGGSAFLEVEILAEVLSLLGLGLPGVLPTPGVLEDVKKEWLLVLYLSSDPLTCHTGEFFFPVYINNPVYHHAVDS